jgi:tRNA(Ile)-lysidine synthase
MLEARGDRMPMVHWQGVEARRYRDRLYLMSPLLRHDSSAVLDWDGETPLELPSGLGVLRVESGAGGIDPEQWAKGSIRVRFRQGGEQFRPAGRDQTHSLKNLLQEMAIPPWMRDRIPLIYIGDQLAAVGDIWIAETFAAKELQHGLRLSWDR